MSKLKMTAREWRRLQKIALDHPFFDVFPPPLSEKEAEELMAQFPHKSGKEFVDSIYASLGMGRPKE